MAEISEWGGLKNPDNAHSMKEVHMSVMGTSSEDPLLAMQAFVDLPVDLEWTITSKWMTGDGDRLLPSVERRSSITFTGDIDGSNVGIRAPGS